MLTPAVNRSTDLCKGTERPKDAELLGELFVCELFVCELIQLGFMSSAATFQVCINEPARKGQAEGTTTSQSAHQTWGVKQLPRQSAEVTR